MTDPEHDQISWRMTRAMAQVLGVNLVAAITEGWFSRADLNRLVDRCADCGLSPHCRAWIAVTPQADHVPAYCPNKTDLEALVF